MNKRYVKLIKEIAVLKGDFHLASGQQSDTYFDMRQVALDPEGALLIVDEIDEVLRFWGEDFDAIGGPTLGADPIVGAYIGIHAVRSFRLHGVVVSKKGFIVRKDKKTHGTRRQIEGPNLKGKRCLIIEDVTTTGESALKAAAAVEEEGGKVVGIIAMFDRSKTDEPPITKYKFTSLARPEDLDKV